MYGISWRGMELPICLSPCSFSQIKLHKQAVLAIQTRKCWFLEDLSSKAKIENICICMTRISKSNKIGMRHSSSIIICCWQLEIVCWRCNYAAATAFQALHGPEPRGWGCGSLALQSMELSEEDGDPSHYTQRWVMFRQKRCTVLWISKRRDLTRSWEWGYR